MAANEQEKILFPSEWCKRFDSSASALEYISKFGIEETEKNAKYLRQRDTRYGTGERQLLDIYYKDKENGTPIIAFIHGGYWQEFSKDGAAFWAGPYIERGYRVILIGYDLCPNISLAGIIDEIKTSIKHILEYAAQTNTETICIMGHSAGAHLAIAALDKEALLQPYIHLVKSIFLMAGIYDLSELPNSSVNENNKLTLDKSNVKKLSPLFYNYEYLKGLKIKIYLCVGEYESPLFIEQSEALHKRLKQFGVDSEYKYINNSDHFSVVENLVNDDYDLTKCLVHEMKFQKIG